MSLKVKLIFLNKVYRSSNSNLVMERWYLVKDFQKRGQEVRLYISFPPNGQDLSLLVRDLIESSSIILISRTQSHCRVYCSFTDLLETWCLRCHPSRKKLDESLRHSLLENSFVAVGLGLWVSFGMTSDTWTARKSETSIFIFQKTEDRLF